MFNKEYWRSSAQKLKDVKYMAIIALFVAIKTVLSSIYIPVGENLRIGINFIFVAIEASIIGPVAGLASGFVTDIVSWIVFPSGPFFFGYTLTAMLGLFVYGICFYRRKITIKHIIIAKVLTNYLINVLLGSLWSACLYSKGYIYYFTKSLIKNTILLPIEVVILVMAFTIISPLLYRKNLITSEFKLKKANK